MANQVSILLNGLVGKRGWNLRESENQI